MRSSRHRYPATPHAIVLTCGQCGTVTFVTADQQDSPDIWRIQDGFISDAGTGYAAEVWIRCPACGTEDQFL